MRRDPSLDSLLDLDGQVLVVDREGDHWVRFVVRRVPVTEARPHGLNYAPVLAWIQGRAPGRLRQRSFGARTSGAWRKTATARDHRHRLRTVRPYDYKDAATLLADFWTEVEAVLRERGMIK